MGFERVEDEWLQAMWGALPRPWPLGAALSWLRYSMRASAAGRAYWVPDSAPVKMQAAALSARPPGRRMLVAVSGLGAKVARNLVKSDVWRDPFDQGPARVPPGSRQGPARVPRTARSAALDVGRGSRQGPARVPPGSRQGPDRARFLTPDTSHQSPDTHTPPGEAPAVHPRGPTDEQSPPDRHDAPPNRSRESARPRFSAGRGPTARSPGDASEGNQSSGGAPPSPPRRSRPGPTGPVDGQAKAVRGSQTPRPTSSPGDPGEQVAPTIRPKRPRAPSSWGTWPKRIDRADLASAVGEFTARVTGRPWRHIEGKGRTLPDVVPRTTARAVCSLLRALEWPDLAEWSQDARQVAEAAHTCPHPLFARDVRAVGWPEGVDRSQSVSTLAASTRWEDRVRVALQWAEAGKPSADWPAPMTPPNGGPPPGWKPPIRDPAEWFDVKF